MILEDLDLQSETQSKLGSNLFNFFFIVQKLYIFYSLLLSIYLLFIAAKYVSCGVSLNKWYHLPNLKCQPPPNNYLHIPGLVSSEPYSYCLRLIVDS